MPDGLSVLSGSTDGTLRRWSLSCNGDSDMAAFPWLLSPISCPHPSPPALARSVPPPLQYALPLVQLPSLHLSARDVAFSVLGANCRYLTTIYIPYVALNTSNMSHSLSLLLHSLPPPPPALVHSLPPPPALPLRLLAPRACAPRPLSASRRPVPLGCRPRAQWPNRRRVKSPYRQGRKARPRRCT